MFPEILVSLICFTAGFAQVEAQAPGIYRLINEKSGSSVRSYKVGNTVYASSTRENVGPFEHWEISPDSARATTIRNVGLDTLVSLDSDNGLDAEVVTTKTAGTTFTFTPVGNDSYIIRVPHRDWVWNVEAPVIPYGNVKLRGQTDGNSARWTLVKVP